LSIELQDVQLPNWPFTALGIAYGQGSRLQLEVLYSEHKRVPAESKLRSAWKARWEHFTDPSNLQPKVRKLNREVENFLLEYPPSEVGQSELDQICDTVLSPWSRREENRLREVWVAEHSSNTAKSLALVDAIKATGIEPFEVPQKFPKIDQEEVRLVCWLAIQADVNA